jgi:hypothetical protein
LYFFNCNNVTLTPALVYIWSGKWDTVSNPVQTE